MPENMTITNQILHLEPVEDEYLGCTFDQCSFSDISLKGIFFENCIFKRCDFSNVKIESQFETVQFQDCKMVGTDFSKMNRFSDALEFTNCNLSFAYFSETNFKETKFEKCILTDADFSSANLSKSIFDDCDLLRVTFSGTNLEGADIVTSFNFDISPVTNRVKGLKVSENGLKGLLTEFDIKISH
jgi:fluoroquinolone resistance protein